MLNMAGMLVKVSTKRCNLLATQCSIQDIKQKIMVLTSECLQCQYYYTTAVRLKKEILKKETKKSKREMIRMISEPKKNLEKVAVWKNITVTELASACGRTERQVFEVLKLLGITGNFNKHSSIDDINLINKILSHLGKKAQFISQLTNSVEELYIEKEMQLTKRPPIDPSVLVPRHPVVTIMGHVDHGKTTLLDALRNTSVVDTEFGGITQHIGAFNVTLSSGEQITFLDTPGHAAFKTMRERGANVTDIVVLVVAADDGVMEQTLQSMAMIRNANVPVIIAINKIDKPNADINKTERMLTQHGILLENLGGDVQSVNISALKKLNLDLLKDAIITQAEVMNLKGDPKGPIEGVIIEASILPGKGKVATCLIQRGSLKRGSIIVAGLAMAKVRAMCDHAGNKVKEAGLSDAVQVIGWKDLPLAGDDILQVESESKAHEIIRVRENLKKRELAVEHGREAEKKHQEYLVVYKEQLRKKRECGQVYKRIEYPENLEKEADKKRVNIIIKGDVVGSVEAILDVLVTYRDHDRCLLSIVEQEVGTLTESDIEMAKIFNAIIYCFNTDISPNLNEVAKNEGVDVRQFNVIYKLIDDLKDEISKQILPLKVEDTIGEAVVLQEFEISEGNKAVKIAGCRCTKGPLKKSGFYKVLRGDEVICRSKLASMRHLKSEVDSIKTDMECGLRFEDTKVSYQPGDIIVNYKIRYEPQNTNWDPGF